MDAAEPVPETSPEPRPSAPTLARVAGAVRPVTLAGDQTIAVPGALGALLPSGGLRRGAVVAVEGAPGTGVTSVAFQLAAAATAVGEWAAFVEAVGARGPAATSTLGARAAEASGLSLERFALVRAPVGEWDAAVGALLEGVSLVVAEVPGRMSPSRAARLVARARERRCVLVALGRWPQGAAVTVTVEGSTWQGIGTSGHLTGVVRHVDVARRGGVHRPGALRSAQAVG